MDKPDWHQIATRLNEALTAARLSSQDLASRAGVDRKTIDRLRGGQAVRPQTLKWVEEALGVSLQETTAVTDGLAPRSYGGYRRENVSNWCGEYVAFRRSYDTRGRIIASYLAIDWDDTVGALRFNESQDNRLASGKAYAYRFGGDVLIPPDLGVMHFVVRSDDGRVRTISTSMPRDDGGTLFMKGFILTLNEIRDIGYYPVTSPIFLARTGPDVPLRTGIVDADDERHAWAEQILSDIEAKFLPYR